MAIKEIASGAILDLDNPYVGIKADFARQPCFDIGFRHGFITAEHGSKKTVGRLRIVKTGLWRRPI